MSKKLIEKYVPKHLLDANVDVRENGTEQFNKLYKDNGHKVNHAVMHVTSVRGGHQGWSSPSTHAQVVLPNDDRIITNNAYGRILREVAQFHISAKTGVVTVLRAASTYKVAAGDNKTLSELFQAPVRYNQTKYTFMPYRIGNQAMRDGLQFRATHDGIQFINPQNDYRIGVDRKISGHVLKELRAADELVNGKADLLSGIYRAAHHWKVNEAVQRRVRELAGDDMRRLVDVMGMPDTALRQLTNRNAIFSDSDTFKDEKKYAGKVLSIKDNKFIDQLWEVTGGNPYHELFAVLLATQPKDSRSIVRLAPLFTAQRGGFNLKVIGEDHDS